MADPEIPSSAQEPGSEPVPLNFTILAHINAGKTSLTEACLYLCGEISHPGRVEDGTTEMDYRRDERERGISISMSAGHFTFGGQPFGVLDTPGHVDFSGEVMKGIAGVDLGVLVIDSLGGFEAQTEALYRTAADRDLPLFVFINKLDRENTDFMASVLMLSDSLGIACAPITVPFVDPVSGELAGCIDLLENCLKIPRDPGEIDDGRYYDVYRVPDSVLAECRDYRDYLFKVLTDAYVGQNFAASGFEEDGFAAIEAGEVEAVRRFLPYAVKNNLFRPVYCGSATRVVGVAELLEGLVRFGRHEHEIPYFLQKKGPVRQFFIDLQGSGGFCGLSLGVFYTRDKERLVLTRIFAGKLQTGQQLYNSSLQRFETTAAIYRVQSQSLQQKKEASRGEIVALAGLALTGTNQTLLEKEGSRVLVPRNRYNPLVTVSLETEAAGDEEKERLQQALKILADEEPAFEWGFDKDSGRFKASGMGELQLEVAVERLRHDFGLSIQASQPAVIYREMLLDGAQGTGIYKINDGFRSAVVLTLASQKGRRVEWSLDRQRELPATLEEADPSDVIPFERLDREKQDDIQAAVFEELARGWLGKAGLENVKVVQAGVATAAPVSRQELKTAAYMAVQDALKKSRVALYEPCLQLELEVSAETSSMVVADLNRRHATIEKVYSVGGRTKIQARAAIRELFGFMKVFRSSTRGRGTASMQFEGYFAVEEN